MIGSRLASNGLIFSGDIPVDNQFGTFLLQSSVSELSIWAKTKKILITFATYKIHST